jgi:hypothetical protein
VRKILEMEDSAGIVLLPPSHRFSTSKIKELSEFFLLDFAVSSSGNLCHHALVDRYLSPLSRSKVLCVRHRHPLSSRSFSFPGFP